jgi:putative hydrolase of the HAD superfamily
MRKKAIILDLDNTIYPVSSIGDKLFKSLLHLISDSGDRE